MHRLHRFFHRENAVTAIEYALLAALISGVIVIGATSVGDALGQIYTYVKDQVVLALQ
jgi:pilus assembly protein Flp/PilA